VHLTLQNIRQLFKSTRKKVVYNRLNQETWVNFKNIEMFINVFISSELKTSKYLYKNSLLQIQFENYKLIIICNIKTV